MFGQKKSKFWDTTKSIMQAKIGLADEELTDEELVDAILESAKSGVDDADGGEGDAPEPKTTANTEGENTTDPKKTDETKSEFAQLITKIDMIANGQTDLGKRLAKVEGLKAKAATNGERNVEETKGKTQFDSKKDAPVFVAD